MAPTVTALVIDNASRDRTVDEVRARKVRLIVNRENRGFAAAVNQGVAACDAEYYLLLNPDVNILTALDTRPEADTLPEPDTLMGACRKYGLACGKLVDKTRIAQRGFTIRRFPTPLMLCFELWGLNRIWPTNPVNRRYRYLDRDLDKEGLVEQPAGAFFMFRKDVWQRLGGLDEAFYPIWFEDVDFCYRASALGYQTRYLPKVAAEHLGAHSISNIRRGPRLELWCVSLVRYAAKHFSPLAYRGICLSVVLTSVPRTVGGMILERSLSPILSCINIIGFAGRRLVSTRGAQERLGQFS